MALWLVRAGKSGEYETKFIESKRIYLTWDNLADDLATLNKENVLARLVHLYPEAKSKTLVNWRSQILPFAHAMQVDDWVVLPSKHKAVIHVGRITGNYTHTTAEPNPFYHYRTIDWFALDVPRDHFAADIIFSFGAFLTICRIQRNDAEARIKAMAVNGWKSAKDTKPTIKLNGGYTGENGDDELSGEVDLNYLAETQISQYLIAKFKGHGMANLVDAIFQAKGYETYVSPPGPDGGVDILAGPAPLGFGHPRLCIQVKTGSPVDTTAVSQLGGVVKEFGADYGLLVSWQGFKQSVEKLRPQRFFSIRLWGQKEIVRELLQHYDQLPEEMRALIPLRRIWILTPGEDE